MSRRETSTSSSTLASLDLVITAMETNPFWFCWSIYGRFISLVDAHSKWPEVYHMSTMTTTKTIQFFKRLFTRYGLPEQLMSDNGPQFVSEEFETFMKRNGVKHIKGSPYYHSSNGQVGRFVRTFKQAVQAGKREGKPLDQRLENFLIMYRITPHTTTGEAPCKFILGRELRTSYIW